MSVQLVERGHNVETYREVAAKRIKVLMEKWTANTLALGAELAKSAETFQQLPNGRRPGFMKWAKATTGLAQSHVSKLLSVHRKFGHRSEEIKLSGKVMFLLAKDDVPESARQEVIGRAAKGERIGGGEAKKIAAKHKLPGPKVANAQAKEEGRPVLASDGNIYFGGSEAQAKEGEDRRTMVFGVRRALEHLGSINLTGRQFLDYALPHQLWEPDEAKIIKQALRWLTDLDEAWENREGAPRKQWSTP
jgi:hypothetical protein